MSKHVLISHLFLSCFDLLDLYQRNDRCCKLLLIHRLNTVVGRRDYHNNNDGNILIIMLLLTIISLISLDYLPTSKEV